ncbi:lipoprotein N-acyltransferase Lnb domain-containing protein [Flavobacterium litorale]|uniref:DUF4105 domain-containing protein n=1 Tax=Flavobacterium litorale TaxID=2856519 RepID=A0ABX8V913_9FLAO|nr:DUF4105 domain-containing protein [Flavobacterium litorale]QYJ67315.1 DUF4105 domain-containing protein [Flavobacterium litorale]
MRSFILTCILLVLFFTSLKSNAQIPLSNRAKVTLLTCDAGEELYSVFGHTAIRVADPSMGLDVVYNFGAFDFSTPNFYLKFVEGNLQYFVSIGSYNDFIAEYQYYQRTVYEQELVLNLSEKQAIADELNSILLSEERRFYTYKFIDRNCTTMVADIISDNIDTELSMDISDKGKSYRAILYNYLDNHFYEKLGINMVFGNETDNTISEVFLPFQLKESLENTTLQGKPLAKPASIIVQGNNGEYRVLLWNSFYSFVITMLLLIYFTKNKKVMLAYMVVTGLLGIFFCAIGFYSSHSEISQNHNTLLINPILLLLAYFVATNKTKAAKVTTYICGALLLIYVLYILNKVHITIMLPIIALHIVVFLRVIQQQKQFANK